MNEKQSKVSKKIRKGDKVIAIAGNYRGKSGTVLSCDGEKVVVQGLNVRKRHMKGQRDRPGQIMQIEKPIHISNLKLCTADGRPVKLRMRIDDAGERQLYYKDGAEDVLYRAVKKPQT
jgi:large subunit ribosomal protein L24